MKKRLLFFCLFAALSCELFSQARFNAFSYDELLGPVLAIQRIHERTQNQINDLTESVMDILAQNIDETLRSQLNADYLNLEKLNRKLNANGVSNDIIIELNSIKSTINTQIVSYNNRVAAEKKKYEEKNRKKTEEPEKWSGTGFALNNGYIVTNYHVVESAKSIRVQGINGDFDTEYSATVISTDRINDLAIIKIVDSRFNGFGIIPYRVKASTSEVGENIFVLGYPLTSTMGDEIKLTTGVISSQTGFQGDVSLYQISAPIQPGNSGGPLFDENGNLIGVINAKHREAENVSYAVKASYLNSLAESASSASILPINNKLFGMSLSNKVKSIKNYVFLITCSNSSSGSSTYSSNSVYSYNDPSSPDKTYNYPSVSTRYDKSLTLISVELKSNETVLTFSYKNNTAGGGINIDRDTYIAANGSQYKLTGTEGIAYSPSKTYFSNVGESKTFKLHFQAIPKNTSSIDFYENARWRWRLYGICLK